MDWLDSIEERWQFRDEILGKSGYLFSLRQIILESFDFIRRFE